MLRPDAYTVRPVGQPETVQRSAAAGDLRQEVFQRNLAGLIGQAVQGQVLSRLTDGSFLVRVAGTPARMNLPQNAQVGSEVPLTLIGMHPRPTFQVGTGNQPGAGPQFAFTEAAPPLLPGPQGSAARGEPLAYREGGAAMARQLAANAQNLPGTAGDVAAEAADARQVQAPPTPPPQQQARPDASAKPPPVVLPPGLATLMGEEEAAPAPDQATPTTADDGMPATAGQRQLPGQPGAAAAGQSGSANRPAPMAGQGGQVEADDAATLRQLGGDSAIDSDWSTRGQAEVAARGPAARAPADALPPERGQLARPGERAVGERALVERAMGERDPGVRQSTGAPNDDAAPELTPAERAAVRAALLARAAADMAQPGPASAKSAAHAAALLEKAPIIPAAFLPEIDPKSTPAQFSEGAKTLTTVLAAAQGLPARTAVLSPAPLASGPDIAPQEMAAQLKDAIGKSGLFYESHVRSWAEGKLALPELANEPQMQRPATLAQPGQAQALESATAQFINLQLTTQEQARVEWQGQVWPGQHMQWDIQRDAPRRGQSGEAEQEAATWRSGVRFSMPHLGDVHAQLVIANGQLHIQVRAGSEATRDQLRQHSRALSSALEAAGSPLSSLDIGGIGGDGDG